MIHAVSCTSGEFLFSSMMSCSSVFVSVPVFHCVHSLCIQLQHRFDIKWIEDESLQTLDDINDSPALSEIDKKYIIGIYRRSKMGWLLKKPSQKDYKLLVEAYGMF